MTRLLITLVLGALLAACASRPPQAPVIERAPGAPAATPAVPVARTVDPRPEFYTVQRGDTLYSIALDNGLDYKEVAEWNGLGDPNVIRSGQVLRLRSPGQSAAAVAGAALAARAADPAVQVKPATVASAVEARPLGVPPSDVKTEPRAVKLPYSEQNLALLSRPRAAGTETGPEPKAEAKPQAKIEPQPAARLEPQADDDKVDWGWPSGGRVVVQFSEPNNKGVDIGGRMGDPVFASASGRVVYSGSGLRGYGKLIIIKHNNTYLSAYAHNSEILVKEGQSVVKGQKIGELGNTDADSAKLHFEIRRLGKPVDPLRFLPGRPS